MQSEVLSYNCYLLFQYILDVTYLSFPSHEVFKQRLKSNIITANKIVFILHCNAQAHSYRQIEHRMIYLYQTIKLLQHLCSHLFCSNSLNQFKVTSQLFPFCLTFWSTFHPSGWITSKWYLLGKKKFSFPKSNRSVLDSTKSVLQSCGSFFFLLNLFRHLAGHHRDIRVL